MDGAFDEVAGMVMAVRPMQVSDLDAVVQIESEVQAFPWSRGQLADSLAAGHQGWVLLAASTEAGRRRVPGLLHAAARVPMTAVRGYALLLPVLDEIELLTIAVARACQGQGYGRLFLSWLMARARAAGMKTMLLEVALRNVPALKLYQALGFVRIGRRNGYYRSAGGCTEDAWVMRAALDAVPVPSAGGQHVID
ncbi:MAG: GNAT family N-acetyltransferase [Lautropia sp.]|nr:GNAT family N-acetyltransferase [Lautropia sp.]